MGARATLKPDGAKLQALIFDRGMTDSDTARKSCLTVNVVKRALRGEPVLQRSAVQIAKALHVKVRDIFSVENDKTN